MLCPSVDKKTTALSQILGENVLELNNDKINFELSKIQLNQAALEAFYLF